MTTEFDIAIVGAGIVGAACANALSEAYSGAKILVVDKESQPAQHQTGRNSGVIHAGVYYAPGSLKARYCREGLERTISFCDRHGIPFRQCGKLLVATDDVEMERMHGLFARCQENGLSPQLLSQQQLAEREPNIRGKGGFFVHQTGITDYVALAQAHLRLAAERGVQVHYQSSISSLVEDETGIRFEVNGEAVKSRLLVNCAGMGADHLIKALGLEPDFQLLPFRGEYYRLPDKFNNVVNHLIYPIPDPELPFLGVHLTLMVGGYVTVGPNAVLAFGREAYGKTEWHWQDIKEMLAFEGTWPLLRREWKSGVNEFKNSWFKPGYLRQVQKYCPQIALEDLLPYRSGIRAQAVDRAGNLLHDFKFVESPHSVHLGNAPSPAATSSMPIADAVVERCRPKLG